MSAAPLGVAVIGAGILGARHARVCHELATTRLVAVVDPDLARATAVAEPRQARAFASIEEMLATVGPAGSDDVRAACVATPDHLHLAPVSTALEAGLDVFVEKPLAMAVGEAQAMVALARARGRVLMVNYSQRWLPEHQRIGALLREGTLGTPAFVESHRWDAAWVPERMIAWSDHTTPIHFMSSHDIDLILHWLGDRVVSVTALSHAGGLQEGRGLAGRVDGYAALLRTARGSVVSLHSSWLLPDTFPLAADSWLELFGGRGSLFLGGSQRELKLYTPDRHERVAYAGPATATEVNGRIEGAFTQSLSAFVDAVRARALDTPTSAAGTLHVVEVQAAIIRSAETGTSVQLTGGDA